MRSACVSVKTTVAVTVGVTFDGKWPSVTCVSSDSSANFDEVHGYQLHLEGIRFDRHVFEGRGDDHRFPPAGDGEVHDGGAHDVFERHPLAARVPTLRVAPHSRADRIGTGCLAVQFVQNVEDLRSRNATYVLGISDVFGVLRDFPQPQAVEQNRSRGLAHFVREDRGELPDDADSLKALQMFARLADFVFEVLLGVERFDEEACSAPHEL